MPNKLNVKFLAEGAKVPTVAHPGEDLGYDLYALEDATIYSDEITKVRTGISVEGDDGLLPVGFVIKDRSSMASKGIFTHGGVIDAGYRGEIVVMMSCQEQSVFAGDTVKHIKSGDKIAQMIPTQVLTGDVVVVDELSTASRGDKGFGSSGV